MPAEPRLTQNNQGLVKLMQMLDKATAGARINYSPHGNRDNALANLAESLFQSSATRIGNDEDKVVLNDPTSKPQSLDAATWDRIVKNRTMLLDHALTTKRMDIAGQLNQLYGIRPYWNRPNLGKQIADFLK